MKKVYEINELRRLIAPIAQAFGVRRLALFGSYARGIATPASDVDLRIVDRGTLRGLFRLAAFQTALEEKLKLNVDVVPTDSLSEVFLDNIKDEEIIVYDG